MESHGIRTGTVAAAASQATAPMAAANASQFQSLCTGDFLKSQLQHISENQNAQSRRTCVTFVEGSPGVETSSTLSYGDLQVNVDTARRFLEDNVNRDHPIIIYGMAGIEAVIAILACGSGMFEFSLVLQTNHHPSSQDEQQIQKLRQFFQRDCVLLVSSQAVLDKHEYSQRLLTEMTTVLDIKAIVQDCASRKLADFPEAQRSPDRMPSVVVVSKASGGICRRISHDALLLKALWAAQTDPVSAWMVLDQDRSEAVTLRFLQTALATAYGKPICIRLCNFKASEGSNGVHTVLLSCFENNNFGITRKRASVSELSARETFTNSELYRREDRQSEWIVYADVFSANEACRVAIHMSRTSPACETIVTKESANKDLLSIVHDCLRFIRIDVSRLHATQPPPLHSAAITLQAAEEDTDERSQLVGSSLVKSPLLLEDNRDGSSSVVLLCLGQINSSLSRDAWMHNQHFRQALSDCDVVLRERCGWRHPLIDILDQRQHSLPASEESSNIWNSQPAIFAQQYALCCATGAIRLRPRSIVGDTFGELLAATIIGVIDLDDALWFVAEYARLVEQFGADEQQRYYSAIVPKTIDDVYRLLEDLRCCHVATSTIKVTHDMGDSVQIIGTYDELSNCLGEDCANRLSQPASLLYTPLEIPAVVDEAQSLLARINFRRVVTDVKVVSSLSGSAVETEKLASPSYWMERLRSPALLSSALRIGVNMSSKSILNLGPITKISEALKARTLVCGYTTWIEPKCSRCAFVCDPANASEVSEDADFSEIRLKERESPSLVRSIESCLSRACHDAVESASQNVCLTFHSTNSPPLPPTKKGDDDAAFPDKLETALPEMCADVTPFGLLRWQRTAEQGISFALTGDGFYGALALRELLLAPATAEVSGSVLQNCCSVWCSDYRCLPDTDTLGTVCDPCSSQKSDTVDIPTSLATEQAKAPCRRPTNTPPGKRVAILSHCTSNSLGSHLRPEAMTLLLPLRSPYRSLTEGRKDERQLSFLDDERFSINNTTGSSGVRVWQHRQFAWTEARHPLLSQPIRSTVSGTREYASCVSDELTRLICTRFENGDLYLSSAILIDLMAAACSQLAQNVEKGSSFKIHGSLTNIKLLDPMVLLSQCECQLKTMVDSSGDLRIDVAPPKAHAGPWWPCCTAMTQQGEESPCSDLNLEQIQHRFCTADGLGVESALERLGEVRCVFPQRRTNSSSSSSDQQEELVKLTVGDAAIGRDSGLSAESLWLSAVLRCVCGYNGVAGTIEGIQRLAVAPTLASASGLWLHFRATSVAEGRASVTATGFLEEDGSTAFRAEGLSFLRAEPLVSWNRQSTLSIGWEVEWQPLDSHSEAQGTASVVDGWYIAGVPECRLSTVRSCLGKSHTYRTMLTEKSPNSNVQHICGAGWAMVLHMSGLWPDVDPLDCLWDAIFMAKQLQPVARGASCCPGAPSRKCESATVFYLTSNSRPIDGQTFGTIPPPHAGIPGFVRTLFAQMDTTEMDESSSAAPKLLLLDVESEEESLSVTGVAQTVLSLWDSARQLSKSSEVEFVQKRRRLFVPRLTGLKEPFLGDGPIQLQLMCVGSRFALQLSPQIELDRVLPMPGHVELRVRATAVTTKLAAETFQNELKGCSAIVVRIPMDAKSEFRVGDAVYGIAADCLKTFCTTSDKMLSLKSDGISFPAASVLAPSLLTAVSALESIKSEFCDETVIGVYGLPHNVEAILRVYCGGLGVTLLSSQALEEYLSLEIPAIPPIDAIFLRAGTASDIAQTLVDGLKQKGSCFVDATNFSQSILAYVKGLRAPRPDLTFRSINQESITESVNSLDNLSRDFILSLAHEISFAVLPLERVPSIFATCQGLQSSTCGTEQDQVPLAITLPTIMADTSSLLAPPTLPLRQVDDQSKLKRVYVVAAASLTQGLFVADWLKNEGVEGQVTLLAPMTEEQATKWYGDSEAIHILNCDPADKQQLLEDLSKLRQVGNARISGLLLLASDPSAAENSNPCEQLKSVYTSSVKAAINLHLLTEELDLEDALEFFITLSPAPAPLGTSNQHGIGSAAASTVLSSLATWRRARGLKHLSVHWCQDDSQSMSEVPTEALMRAFGELLRRSPKQSSSVVYLSTDGSLTRQATRQSYSLSQQDLKEKLSTSPSAEQLVTLAPQEEEQKLSSVIGVPRASIMKTLIQVVECVVCCSEDEITEETILTDLGIDSLGAIGLRQEVQEAFGVSLPSSFLNDGITLSGLVEIILHETSRLPIQGGQENSAQAPASEDGDALSGKSLISEDQQSTERDRSSIKASCNSADGQTKKAGTSSVQYNVLHNIISVIVGWLLMALARVLLGF